MRTSPKEKQSAQRKKPSRATVSGKVNRNVFINCPFSDDYNAHFRALVFTVVRSGFEPRCARENDDGGEVRIEKICRIINACRYGIHDISKTELDTKSRLPRFNMPLELGLFLGAKAFSDSRKKALIFDRSPFRFQKFISDISGQDIHAHGNSIGPLIVKTASWLRDEALVANVPGGVVIAADFRRFKRALPKMCNSLQLDESELTFKDYRLLAANWIAADQVVT